MQSNPYLNFDGQCRAAFEFYAKALGATIDVIMTHADSPMAGDVPPEWRDKVIHAQLDVGGTKLMGADAPPSGEGCYELPQGFSVAVHPETPAEAERVFNALADKGTISMPLQETFWALSFGTLVDRFGIPWMVNCSRPM